MERAAMTQTNCDSITFLRSTITELITNGVAVLGYHGRFEWPRRKSPKLPSDYRERLLSELQAVRPGFACISLACEEFELPPPYGTDCVGVKFAALLSDGGEAVLGVLQAAARALAWVPKNAETEQCTKAIVRQVCCLAERTHEIEILVGPLNVVECVGTDDVLPVLLDELGKAKPMQTANEERSTPPLAALVAIRAKPCELICAMLYQLISNEHGELTYAEAYTLLKGDGRWRELLPQCMAWINELCPSYDVARFTLPAFAKQFEKYTATGLQALGKGKNAPRHGRTGRSVVRRTDL
jgi:hypothetical protein